jgi:uncharacterized delta-60 repeat protein
MKTKIRVFAAWILLASVHDNVRGSTIEFPTSGPIVIETEGEAVVSVERSGDTSGIVTVDYVASDGTAQAGLDYRAASGTLVFGPSETSKTFAVPILDDRLAEGDETVNLTLSNPTGGASLSPQKTSVVTILDNERPGGLDTSFGGFRSFSCDCRFSVLKIQQDGKVLAVSSEPGESDLRRYNQDGSWDNGFFYSGVAALAVQSDGWIMVGGTFTNINRTLRRGLARLHAGGSLDTTFDTGSGISPLSFGSGRSPASWCGSGVNPYSSDSDVLTIALQADGKILIGGGFTKVGGFARNGVARLNPDGSVDASFDAALGGIYPCEWLVSALIVQPDGKLLLGGSFSKIKGISRNGLARLNPDGSLDARFEAVGPVVNLDSQRGLLALQPDGKILTAFSEGQNGGPWRNGLARLNADGSMDTNFVTFVDSMADQGQILIWEAAVQPDGRIIIGGSFHTVNGISRQGVARLNLDGSLDTTFEAPVWIHGSPPKISALALQPDGEFLPPLLPRTSAVARLAEVNLRKQTHENQTLLLDGCPDGQFKHCGLGPGGQHHSIYGGQLLRCRKRRFRHDHRTAVE